MKGFFKEYPYLCCTAVVSFIYAVYYSVALYSLNDSICHRLLVLLYQLSIGIVINGIFFFTQVYLFRKKKRKYIDGYILKSIDRIENYISQLFNNLDVIYKVRQGNCYTKPELLTLLQKTNFKDYVHVIRPDRAHQNNKYYSVREYIHLCLYGVEKEIDTIFMRYGEYVEPELASVFDEIIHSQMHQSIGRSFLGIASISFSSCQDDIYYYPYYGFIGELEAKKSLYT